ncbi:MAG: hypothetical protein ACPGVL_05390 [Pseudoalteromonas spongiae]
MAEKSAFFIIMVSLKKLCRHTQRTYTAAKALAFGKSAVVATYGSFSGERECSTAFMAFCEFNDFFNCFLFNIIATIKA